MITKPKPNLLMQNQQARERELFDKGERDSAAKGLYDQEHYADRVGDLAPGWGEFFDREAIRGLSENLRGRESRTNYAGAGNGISVASGGQTQARYSPGTGLRSLARAVEPEATETTQPQTGMDSATYWDRREKMSNAAHDRAASAAAQLENEDNDLATGRTAWRANKQAEVQGDAKQIAFNKEQPIREMKRFEERSHWRDQGFEDPAVEKARIEAESRNKENQSNKAKAESAAMQQFTKLVSQLATTEPEIDGPTDPASGVDISGGLIPNFPRWGAKKTKRPNPAYEQLAAAVEEMRGQFGNMAGNPQEEEGANGSVSMSDIAEVAKEQGWTVQQAVDEARKRGYAVR